MAVRTVKPQSKSWNGRDRLVARLDALDGNIAAFSHSHFSRSLAAPWAGLSVVDGQHFSLDTGSLSVI
jgi:probable phosphoglycerate mutase